MGAQRTAPVRTNTSRGPLKYVRAAPIRAHGTQWSLWPTTELVSKPGESVGDSMQDLSD
jgi:hypothetical protein